MGPTLALRFTSLLFVPLPARADLLAKIVTGVAVKQFIELKIGLVMPLWRPQLRQDSTKETTCQLDDED